MAEMTVHIRTHHFVVRQVQARGIAAVESFARRYVQYGMVRENRRWFRAALKVFAAATQNKSEYRFHINTLSAFRQHLEQNWLKGDMIEWVEEVIPTPTQVALPIFPTWETRDYQVPVVEYLENAGPPRSKFVDIQTGKGKSYCTMRAMADLGYRTLFVLKPKYIEKWLIDLKKTFDLPDDSIMTVSGADNLMALLQMAVDGQLDAVRIIIISNRTLQNFLKLYELHAEGVLELGFACLPDQLCALLGIGMRVIDEVHEDFHLNFKIDLYTHVERSIALSATLVSDDDFLRNMHEVAYPKAEQFKGGAYDKYVDAHAVIYRLRHPNKVRTTEWGSKSYSHHAFEKSVMRQQELLTNYLGLIDAVVHGIYLQNYKEGDKLLVYAAGIDFCTLLANYLRKKHLTLDVRRYVEEDPYENLMEADICVSTVQSAGTGVDIKQLTAVILTTALNSTASNIQGFGRLRKLPDGTVPQFAYFVCEDIKKHVTYHERKRVLLKERALSYRAEFIGQPI